jgi:hypothetical protein
LNDELDGLNLLDKDGNRPLPGHPRVGLANVGALTLFLEQELCSQDLEKMAPYLWMMSLRSSTNISPLHRQRVKGREILITEDPKLHLVWLPNRIHIKPLPAYLLSFEFWDVYLVRPSSPLRDESRRRILTAALGYVRTFYYLIKYESDFILAQECCLIPKSVSWPQFCAFTSKFCSISDDDVSPRYSFGELRLSRLNFYCKFILWKFQVQHVHTSYASYFSRFYAPFLFVFGISTVLLSALQVELQLEPLTQVSRPSFWIACHWCAFLTLFLVLILTALLFSLFLYRFVSEWQHAIRDELGRRRETSAAGKRKEDEMA